MVETLETIDFAILALYRRAMSSHLSVGVSAVVVVSESRTVTISCCTCRNRLIKAF